MFFLLCCSYNSILNTTEVSSIGSFHEVNVLRVYFLFLCYPTYQSSGRPMDIISDGLGIPNFTIWWIQWSTLSIALDTSTTPSFGRLKKDGCLAIAHDILNFEAQCYLLFLLSFTQAFVSSHTFNNSSFIGLFSEYYMMNLPQKSTFVWYHDESFVFASRYLSNLFTASACLVLGLALNLAHWCTAHAMSGLVDFSRYKSFPIKKQFQTYQIKPWWKNVFKPCNLNPSNKLPWTHCKPGNLYQDHLTDVLMVRCNHCIHGFFFMHTPLILSRTSDSCKPNLKVLGYCWWKRYNCFLIHLIICSTVAVP
jgi:hypothetical protein